MKKIIFVKIVDKKRLLVVIALSLMFKNIGMQNQGTLRRLLIANQDGCLISLRL